MRCWWSTPACSRRSTAAMSATGAARSSRANCLTRLIASRWPAPAKSQVCPWRRAPSYLADRPVAASWMVSLTVARRPAVRGGRVARRQQRRAGEQFLAHGAGAIVALVDAAFLQDRHDQVDEILETLGGHDAAEVEAVDVGLVDPGDQVLGDLLGRADDGRITAAQTHPADDAPHGPWFGAQCRQRLDSRVDRIVLHVTDRLVGPLVREVAACWGCA